MLKIINKDKRKRSFKMTIGLVEGYDNGKRHSMQEAEKIIQDWLVAQHSFSGTYLPGRIDYNMSLYSHHGQSIAEPTAVYKGEVSPLYNSKVPDAKIIKALIELANILAIKLNQTRIYLTYRDEIFILEIEDKKK